MHKEVVKCADSGDVKGLRYIFADCLDVDPTFEKYKEDFEYCKNLSGLFESYRELTPLKDSPSEWNKIYWENLKTDLLNNFSLKRFEHMVKVAKVVYSEKVQRLMNERKSVNENNTAIGKQNLPTDTMIVGKEDRFSKSNTAHNKIANAEQMRQQQEKELEQERKKYELEYRRSRAQQEAEQKKREAVRAQSISPDNESGSQSKKVIGGVLLVSIVIIILIILLH